MRNSQDNNVPAVDRRQVVKGVVWAAPLVTAAIAAPATAASPPAWDVAVTGAYSTGLIGLIGRARLSFTITAVAGTVPSGTSFTLSSSEKVNMSALVERAVPGLTVAAAPNTTSALVTLAAPLAEGNSVTINLLEMRMAVGVAYTFTLQLNGSDRPLIPTADAPDSATLSAVLRVNTGSTTLVLPTPGP